MRTAILDGMIQFLSTPSARRATAKRMKAKIRHWISIHALREEGDAIPPQATGGILIFLSTPSARRATRREDDESRRDKISIHALREEGDCQFSSQLQG